MFSSDWQSGERNTVRAGIDNSDPVSVVLRQDVAFRGGDIDTDLWLTTLYLPLVMLTNGRTILYPDPETAVDELNVLGDAAKKWALLLCARGSCPTFNRHRICRSFVRFVTGWMLTAP